ncbi:Signal transduction regulator [Halanaeroarchaeum sp. HSR-CO]|uniref:GAF domain-containing sensor histidine kinase n=1 Tax=Halanaeroarchaeum sp. HSR-CO TaxID=2866382 RepID=UPI00217EF504|nr:GAF domain-containing sensor histidine kinase [Halanaeroarchaeum sp. HSR-CO]UWG46878.1 Signal transduction regulator [Halanaeroarchaeum sp. HSR-CO]
MDEQRTLEDRECPRLHGNWSAAMELVDVKSSPEYGFESGIRRGLEILTDRSGFPLAYLAHIDDGRQQFRVVNDELGVEAVDEGRTDSLSNSYCRFTVAGEPGLTVIRAGHDVGRDDPAYQAFGFEVYVGVPVRVDGNLYGTLCLGDVDPDRESPSTELRSFVQFVAAWMGAQIQRLEQARHTAVLQRVLRHNLRNSLNIISGYADTLPDIERCYPALDIIQEEASSLVRLSREAQRMEAILHGHTQLQRIDLGSALATLVADVRRSHPNATIELNGTEPITVSAISHLRFALEELVRNAIEHADRPDPTVTVTVDEDDDNVGVRVADDGPGIPETEAEPLRGPDDVDPVNHGSGLGLWLVRLIVQQSNGSISIRTGDPRGTVVVVRLHRSNTGSASNENA